MASEPAGAEPRTRWQSVAAGIFAGAAAAFSLGKVPPLLPALRSDLALDLTAAGWIASSFNVMAMVLAVAFAIALARWRAAGVVMTGLVLLASGGLAALAATGFWSLLFARIVEGAGFLSVTVAMPPILAAASAESDRRFVFALWSTYLPAGAAIGMAASALLVDSIGWRAAWGWSALVPLVALALFAATGSARLGPLARARASGDALTTIKLALTRGGYPRFAASFFAYAAMLWGILVWLPTVLGEGGVMSSHGRALASAFVVLANIPGNLIGAALLRSGVTTVALVAAALIGLAVSGAVFYWPDMPAGLRYGAAVAGSCIGGLLPPALLATPLRVARSPLELAAMQGGFVQAAALGQFLGPLVVAAVVSFASDDWGMARWLFGAAAALALTLLWVKPRG